jgi:hypothetical protein
MRHARSDYNEIDLEKKIPGDEPVFLVRGQDKLTPWLIRRYAGILPVENDPEMQKIADSLDAWADHVEDWQLANTNRVKSVDVPEGVSLFSSKTKP